MQPVDAHRASARLGCGAAPILAGFLQPEGPRQTKFAGRAPATGARR